MDTKSKQACKRSNSCANDKCGNTGEMIFNGMCNKCFKNTRRRSDSTINGQCCNIKLIIKIILRDFAPIPMYVGNGKNATSVI